MPDADHEDDELIITDLVQHAVITHSNAPDSLSGPAQQDGTARPRIDLQAVKRTDDPPLRSDLKGF